MANPILGIKEFYDAVGGPAEAVMASDGYEAGPTDPGTYRVAHVSRHVSDSKYKLSKIPWGAPLRVSGEKLEANIGGKWSDVEKLTGYSLKTIEGHYKSLGYKGGIRDTWLLNDFGHKTVYLYKDRNKNAHWDRASEPIHGEFVHPTAEYEAAEIRAEEKKTVPAYRLTPSHGCVHMRPGDIDEMQTEGFLRANTPFVVYPYRTTMTTFRNDVANVGPPYAIHFYPGMQKLLVVGVQKRYGH